MKRTLRLPPQPLSKQQINFAVRSMLTGSLAMLLLPACSNTNYRKGDAPCKAVQVPAETLDTSQADRLQQQLDALTQNLRSSQPTPKP